MSDRIEERVADMRKLDMAVGFASTHFFVADEQTIDSFGLKLDQSETDRETDVWGSATDVYTPRDHVAGNIIVEVIDYSVPNSETTETKSANYRHFLVHTVNISHNGYCIAWPAAEGKLLLNGDIICLRENDAPCWSVGNIRWIKKQTEDVLHVGISVLSHAAEPYAARRVHGGEDIYRALLLGAESISGKLSTLLLPNVTMPESAELELAQPTGNIRVRLKNVVYQTRHFVQYEYSPVSQEKTQKREHKDQAGDELSAIWEVL